MSLILAIEQEAQQILAEPVRRGLRPGRKVEIELAIRFDSKETALRCRAQILAERTCPCSARTLHYEQPQHHCVTPVQMRLGVAPLAEALAMVHRAADAHGGRYDGWKLEHPKIPSELPPLDEPSPDRAAIDDENQRVLEEIASRGTGMAGPKRFDFDIKLPTYTIAAGHAEWRSRCCRPLRRHLSPRERRMGAGGWWSRP